MSESTDNKVRVKIAVAVDSTGEWNSSGWKADRPGYDEDAMGLAAEIVKDGAARYWIEAELPIPAVQTITDVQVSKVESE